MTQKNSLIKDNQKRGSVGDFLKEHIKENTELAFVSAYFTIYAYDKLKPQLDAAGRLRFLFGEPTFLKSIDPNKTNKRDYKIQDDSMVVSVNSYIQQKMIAKECADWIKEKVDIKSMIKPNFLHGKMYHIQRGEVEKAIVGSSNFTVNGLGLGGSPNIELNMIVDGERDRNDLKAWFDEIWNDKTGLVEDVKEAVLKYLESHYIDNEPEFVYFKTLYHVFESFLQEQDKGGLLNEKTGFYESEIWGMLYKFQQDGVKGAINKILKHNGCIIADSVGLGKTFEALAVIRYFELLNKNVLVLCPKKLATNWTVYQASQGSDLNPFKKDRFGYTVLYHTDMGRERGKSDANGINLENFSWGAYDLVVIDESHNFRGNPMEKQKDDGSVKMNRSMWLMNKIIKSGTKTKVLLLSATPVNNNLKDLRNQMLLITEGKNNALLESAQVKDIAATLKIAQTQFTNWAALDNKDRTVKQLLEKIEPSFFKLLDELTIARSRKHIKSFYNAEAEIGKFPTREKPISVYPQIDLMDRFPTYDSINQTIKQYKLSIFNPSAYVLEGCKAAYEEMAKSSGIKGFKQNDRESYLIGMMKVNFLKRLESSIESFEISIDRTIKKIEELEKKIADFKASQKENIHVSFESPTTNDIMPEEEEDDIDEQWQVGKKLKFDLADLNLDAWLHDLQKDKDALSTLYNLATAVSPERDAKLNALKETIEEKIEKGKNNNNKKVIVFTAFADTATYIYSQLKDWAHKEHKLNIALVAGSDNRTTFGKNDFSHILTNFSPVSKKRNQMNTLPQEGEIDILIATDCISEGQNLQDCDFLVNYDIHWNPVRIIQRFGRIDRLGSKNDSIQLVNFWPTKDLDNYINLKERVESRMALVDMAATAEDNLLATDQIEELIEEDLKYRNQQLKRLQNEVLDLEDMDGGVSLTDFTLDDFKIDLSNFIDKNKKQLQDAPLGLYAVVPAPKNEYNNRTFSATESEIIKPGTIYCLRQKGGNEGNETVNPTHPYFLVYIYENGTVKYNFASIKQVLEIYRLLCSNQKKIYQPLCDLFNKETNEGKNMKKYVDLLQITTDAISATFNKRSNAKLTSGDRGALLIPQLKRISELNQFELITWLVIK